jgi:hypothetical protein
MLTVGGTRFGLYPARGGETADALLVQLLDRGVLFVGDAFTPYLGAAICARHSVYARSELPEPSHQVETPLLPSAKYFWTVRARLMLDGVTRVTPWARILGSGSSDVVAPSRYYFGLKTPAR